MTMSMYSHNHSAEPTKRKSKHTMTDSTQNISETTDQRKAKQPATLPN